MITIATRQSPLALWQANYVSDQITECLSIACKLLPKTTEGDIKLATSLAWSGGKGLFIKELQHAILENKADICVHSMKDVPVQTDPRFTIAAILPRHSPRDSFISNKYNQLSQLPDQAVVGTSSLRRQSQVLNQYPYLSIKLLRGNIHTRLQKLDDGLYDAIILAEAGLERMQMERCIRQTFSETAMIPAVAQGAIGIECLSTNQQLISQLSALNDESTELCVIAERLVSQYLGGSCHAPIGCYAHIKDKQLHINAVVLSPDGKQYCQAQQSGEIADSEHLAQAVADSLKQQGAQEIIQQIEVFQKTELKNE